MNGRGAGRGRRVLIVDDERTIVLATARYLEHQGFEVDSALNSADAFRLLDESRYDVVVIDLNLLESDGREGLSVLTRVSERSPATRSVLVTAYGTDEVLAEARRLGAVITLRKPVRLADLTRIILGLVEDSR